MSLPDTNLKATRCQFGIKHRASPEVELLEERHATMHVTQFTKSINHENDAFVQQLHVVLGCATSVLTHHHRREAWFERNAVRRHVRRGRSNCGRRRDDGDLGGHLGVVPLTVSDKVVAPRLPVKLNVLLALPELLVGVVVLLALVLVVGELVVLLALVDRGAGGGVVDVDVARVDGSHDGCWLV